MSLEASLRQASGYTRLMGPGVLESGRLVIPTLACRRRQMIAECPVMPMCGRWLWRSFTPLSLTDTLGYEVLDVGSCVGQGCLDCVSVADAEEAPGQPGTGEFAGGLAGSAAGAARYGQRDLLC